MHVMAELCVPFLPASWPLPTRHACHPLLPCHALASKRPLFACPPQEHDIASKQYLLLPLLTPSHGSLLVVCQPVEQQGTGKGKDRLELPWRGREQRPLILHLDSGEPRMRLISRLFSHVKIDEDTGSCYLLSMLIQ